MKATIGTSRYRTELTVREHHLVADEPAAHGGSDVGPAPTEFVLAGLGACTSITLTMYAQRKGWPLEGVEVDVELEGEKDKRIRRTVNLKGPLDDEQRARLLQIANACPVHKLLSGGIAIETTLGGVA